MTRSLRSGALTIAALTASFALAACGGDDGGDTAKGSGTDASASATPSADGSGQPAGGGATDTAALEGTWTGLTDGKNVTLSVTSGKAVVVADRSVCHGDVKDMGGEPMFALSCKGGSDRTMGAIESVDAKKLVVSWDGGPKDSLVRAEAGKLPSGMPSLPDVSGLPEVPAP
ncbi:MULTISPECIES: hypothetical protein [Streptomyces]|uniref:Lipoprotein n=1 Tax=Streptomyces californicus TaxID=67351 RepID=A0ABD7CV31_9ACTN|nr:MULTISPECIES: hypothetical protein [Streptomyces]NEA09768.1 hypothetical protein [Streptomyces sp. SID10692]QRV29231.1 hypothetical protein I6J39_19430 [Streptomyces californicus]QRV35162.1 hypothetical protein I6J42_14665 [Streptomyces californicus]QRV42644.1 hypothetical protein I6J41_19345 [Streptomyces californicus]QRV49330.1 hypothetical protein I6J43_18980 [Streptomyces californicus]